MPLNLLKKYPELLDLFGSFETMNASLRRVYDRDIVNNEDFKFRGIQIHPLKSEEGQLDMDMTFKHLTTKKYAYDENGEENSNNSRQFDINRSRRLHWINHHLHEASPENIDIFTVVERDKKKRQDVKHTYIYDNVKKYVIVFDRRPKKDFYLLTAYYLDEPFAEKALEKKKKKKEVDVL